MDARNDNYTLIGMPGCGKSTIGPMLAYVLGYEFEDTDWIIEESENALLPDIIEQIGQDGFLDLEQKYASSLDVQHTVIATGGSVIYREPSMAHLKNISTIIYLKVSVQELLRRLGDLKKRGVIIKDGWNFADLYAERTAHYERWADWTIDASHLEPKELVRSLAIQHQAQD